MKRPRKRGTDALFQAISTTIAADESQYGSNYSGSNRPTPVTWPVNCVGNSGGVVAYYPRRTPSPRHYGRRRRSSSR